MCLLYLFTHSSDCCKLRAKKPSSCQHDKDSIAFATRSHVWFCHELMRLIQTQSDMARKSRCLKMWNRRAINKRSKQGASEQVLSLNSNTLNPHFCWFEVPYLLISYLRNANLPAYSANLKDSFLRIEWDPLAKAMGYFKANLSGI